MSLYTAPPTYPAMSKSKLLNNESCRLIRSNKLNEAISSLMTALKLAKSTAEDHKTQAHSDSQSSYGGEADTVSPQDSSPCALDSMVVDQDALSASLPADASAGPYVYSTPVVIPSLYGDESVATLSFIIMFNLALAHHLKSIEQQQQEDEDVEESKKTIEIAKRLYELTFQMQAQEVQTNLILTSALLNNLSLVHASLENQHEAKQCEQLLLSTLLLLVDIGGATPETECVLDGFMDNVMHLIVVQSSVASAA